MLVDVFESYSVKTDERLGRTTAKRVKHATWPGTVRLFLLLGTDVDAPPDWHPNLKVLVKNVFNGASSSWCVNSQLLIFAICWICLDIDGLEWLVHFNVGKSDVANAIPVGTRRHRPNRHAHSIHRL